MPISLSGSLVLTGSITTTGGITISGSILSASYSATSSFSNDFTVLGNLTVFGTQSVQYITSSQLNISDNVITVNVASPGVRFGGLAVFDSGSQSSEATASLFWDSQQNHWIYQRESGSTYNGGMLISGPRNSAGLGNESGTTACMLLVGQGGDHLTSSMIYHDSTKTCFYANSFISSSGIACFSATVCANTITGATVSAGVPTNSRIVSNASTMYGFYDTEINPRWTLGRDVWAGGSGGLAFGVGAGGTCYAIIGDPSGFGCTIGFSVLVPNGCSGTIYEKMRITTGGVLIGKTSSTGGKLQVSNGTDMFNVDHDANGPYISAVNNANTVYKRMTYDASEHVFNISAASRVYITSGGLIGVNTASPFNFGTNSGMIDVRSQNTSAVSGVFISNSDATARLTAYINNAATATVGTSTSHALQLVTVDAERARIQTNGFMGIATSSPKAVFDVACGAAHSIISTWCKGASNNTMYNGFDIYMDESSFSGQLYVQANGGGIGIQAVYDVLASYDRICVIVRNCMNRGNGESLTIPSYFFQSGAKRICIQQNNGAGAQMNISAMLVGTAYGGSYICAQG
jgi:hypothetical protein